MTRPHPRAPTECHLSGPDPGLGLCSQCRSEGGEGGGETPASVLPASTICFSFFSHLFLPPFPGPGFPDMSHVALLTLKFESHCWNHCQSCNPPALRVLRVFPRNSLSFPAVDSIVRGRSLPQRRKEKASVIGRKEKHTGEEVGRSPREKNNEEIKQCAFLCSSFISKTFNKGHIRPLLAGRVS